MFSPLTHTVPTNRAQRRALAQTRKRDARAQARSRARIQNALNRYPEGATV